MLRAMYITLSCLLWFSSCSTSSPAASVKGDVLLEGSTPAGSEIRQSLGIEDDRPVDFIRWQLRLSDTSRNFTGSIIFGEGEPNTRGFKGGGETRILSGTYEAGDQVFRLSGDALKLRLLLASLDGRIFHFVGSDNKLMIGNGGWSYTLARRDHAARKGSQLVSRSKSMLNESHPETVFEGRTPCVDLGRPELPFAEGCMKLKWRLRLRRDGSTKTVGTYLLESTLNRRQTLEGRWSLVNGTHTNPRALFIRLDADRPDGGIDFFVGDEGVIFLTDHNESLLPGNTDFGFSLNRKENGPAAGGN